MWLVWVPIHSIREVRDEIVFICTSNVYAVCSFVFFPSLNLHGNCMGVHTECLSAHTYCMGTHTLYSCTMCWIFFLSLQICMLSVFLYFLSYLYSLRDLYGNPYTLYLCSVFSFVDFHLKIGWWLHLRIPSDLIHVWGHIQFVWATIQPVCCSKRWFFYVFSFKFAVAIG